MQKISSQTKYWSRVSFELICRTPILFPFEVGENKCNLEEEVLTNRDSFTVVELLTQILLFHLFANCVEVLLITHLQMNLLNGTMIIKEVLAYMYTGMDAVYSLHACPFL